MRFRRPLRQTPCERFLYAGLLILLAIVSLEGELGCGRRTHHPHAVASQMPANTVLLSQMMRELSARPGFTEAFLKQIDGGAKPSGSKGVGAALLTPALVDRMRAIILGKDWQGLDHFPGWTMGEINPTVRVVGHVAGRDQKVEAIATAGGAPSGNGRAGRRAAEAFVDLGSYGLEKAEGVDLGTPAKGLGFNEKDFVSSLGDGVTRGDGANPELAPLHAESARLAEVLNRLSLNRLEGVALFRVSLADKIATSPEAMLAALETSGHHVTVADSRYFANFGHLHYTGRDVMMPFFVDPKIIVPGEGKALLVPVSHAEYEWFVRGPKVNAAVSFYFGIDGKAEFRTMDQLDQRWVMNRHAHEYRGAEAIEVTRLSGEMVRAYAHLHQAHPKIPFGGYYAFGVCQDVIAAIELKMTGRATLFPNTADATFFTDERDAEINALIRRLPKDRDGGEPQVERIFGSLPVGSSDAELATISIPGLGADLIAVHDAWTAGTLERTHAGWRRWVRLQLMVLGLALGFGVAVWLRRRSRDSA